MKMACPDEERLVDYLEGRLSDKDRFQLEEHLSDCQVCLQAAVITKGMVKDIDRFELEPVPSHVTESAVRLVSSLSGKSGESTIDNLARSIKKTAAKISDALHLASWGNLQLVPIRGSKTLSSEDLVRLTVSFGKIQMEIEIEKTGSGKALIRVKPHKASKAKKVLRITLKKKDRDIASYLLDGDYVLFEDIPFGNYGISLAENGVDLGTYPFEVKDSAHGKK